MPIAQFVNRLGQQVTMKIIRSQNKLWAENDGIRTEFSDPLYHPVSGDELAFVELDPPDNTLQPEDRHARKVKNLRHLGL
jgi:hypothetical protein